MRTFQEISVGRFIALDRWGPVVISVLGIASVRPPFQLVPEPLHRPCPLPLQITITLDIGGKLKLNFVKCQFSSAKSPFSEGANL